MNRGLWSIVAVAVACATGIVIAEQVRGQAAAQAPDPPGAGFELGASANQLTQMAAAPINSRNNPRAGAFQGTIQAVSPAEKTIVVALARPATGTATLRVVKDTRILRQVTGPASNLKIGDRVQAVGQPVRMDVTEIRSEPGSPASTPGGVSGGLAPGAAPRGPSTTPSVTATVQVPVEGRIVSTKPIQIDLGDNVRCTLNLRPGAGVTRVVSAELEDLRPGESIRGTGPSDTDGTVEARNIQVGFPETTAAGFGGAFGSGNGGAPGPFRGPGLFGGPGRPGAPRGLAAPGATPLRELQ